MPHRFEACDYVAVRNPFAKDGQWVMNGRREAVYVRTRLDLAARLDAAKALEAEALARAAAAKQKQKEERAKAKQAEEQRATTKAKAAEKPAEKAREQTEKTKNGGGLSDNVDNDVSDTARRRPGDDR